MRSKQRMRSWWLIRRNSPVFLNRIRTLAQTIPSSPSPRREASQRRASRAAPVAPGPDLRGGASRLSTQECGNGEDYGTRFGVAVPHGPEWPSQWWDDTGHDHGQRKVEHGKRRMIETENKFPPGVSCASFGCWRPAGTQPGRPAPFHGMRDIAGMEGWTVGPGRTLNLVVVLAQTFPAPCLDSFQSQRL